MADKEEACDEMLRGAAAAWPALTSVDVSGCQNVSSIGVRALVKGLGARFASFAQDVTVAHPRCSEMRVTPTTMVVLAAARSLVDLSLTLPTKFSGSALSPLAGHPHLRRLALLFEGFPHVDIPGPLPNLEEARLCTNMWTHFDWSRAFVNTTAASPWPRLHSLHINDSSGNYPAPPQHVLAVNALSLTTLEQLCLRLPAMIAGAGVLTIERLGTFHGLTCAQLAAPGGVLAAAGIRIVADLTQPQIGFKWAAAVAGPRGVVP